MPKHNESNDTSTLTRELTPFELYEERARKRGLMIRIIEDLQRVIDSYEQLPLVSAETGIALEDLEEMAEKAIIELTEAYEELGGGVQ
jgi:hypothetical protein